MAIEIVVIDDTKHVRDMLVSLLTLDGFHIVGQGASGEEAVDLAAKHSPDVVVIDYAMAGMNGLEAARTILKADPQQNIILYTAYVSKELKQEASRVGVALCVGKAEGLETLERSISELCIQLER
ncbi:MAG: response regulator transcription factor [Actinomycetota bacterium]